jgi:hypothetical protein
MTIFSKIDFLSSASFATTGSELSIPGVVDNLSKVYVSLSPMSGASASRAVVFEGKTDTGGYVTLLGTDMTAGTTGSGTVSLAEQLWSIPVAGVNKVRCNLTSISGSFTAKGKLVI